jgi:hypothetical protein
MSTHKESPSFLFVSEYATLWMHHDIFYSFSIEQSLCNFQGFAITNKLQMIT